MRLISDDQVEEAHIELGEAIHHAWVSGDVDAGGLIHFVGFANHAAWLAGQVLLEGIIGLHTYSQSPHREYDITLTGNWVERGGFRFQDFVLTRRKEVNTDGNH